MSMKSMTIKPSESAKPQLPRDLAAASTLVFSAISPRRFTASREFTSIASRLVSSITISPPDFSGRAVVDSLDLIFEIEPGEDRLSPV